MGRRVSLEKMATEVTLVTRVDLVNGVRLA